MPPPGREPVAANLQAFQETPNTFMNSRKKMFPAVPTLSFSLQGKNNIQPAFIFTFQRCLDSCTVSQVTGVNLRAPWAKSRPTPHRANGVRWSRTHARTQAQTRGEIIKLQTERTWGSRQNECASTKPLPPQPPRSTKKEGKGSAEVGNFRNPANNTAKTKFTSPANTSLLKHSSNSNQVGKESFWLRNVSHKGLRNVKSHKVTDWLMKLTGEKSFISLLGSKYPALVFTGQVYTNEIPKSITSSVDFFPLVFFPVVRHLVFYFVSFTPMWFIYSRVWLKWLQICGKLRRWHFPDFGLENVNRKSLPVDYISSARNLSKNNCTLLY